MFLDTSGGILMYFYHAEIKILNEWLYTPQEGFIPLEVCTAALLSYPPSCTVYNPNSLQVLTKRPIYNFHLIDDHVWYNNTLQGIALGVGGDKRSLRKGFEGNDPGAWPAEEEGRHVGISLEVCLCKRLRKPCSRSASSLHWYCNAKWGIGGCSDVAIDL